MRIRCGRIQLKGVAVYQRVDRFMNGLSAWLALLGGVVLVGLTVMTVVSIVGRTFNRFGLGPVPGDFEIIEMGAAFAIFAFLPWCQYRRGHVTVDIFMARFGEKVNFAIDVIANALMTLAAAIMLWRLTLGMLDKHAYHETSFILQFPIWWGYAASMVGAVAFLLISAFTVWRSFREYARAGAAFNT